MKKILITLFTSVSSCIYVSTPVPPQNQQVYTYGVYYQQPPQRDCTCGYVLEKGVDDYGRYFMQVQNQCTGNVKRFVFEKDDWVQFKISDCVCLKQNSSW